MSETVVSWLALLALATLISVTAAVPDGSCPRPGQPAPLPAPHSPCIEQDPRATFVTALYDIGRGEWPRYRRDYSLYKARLTHLLALHIDLVIFLDPADVPFVAQARERLGLLGRTWVMARPFRRLELARFRERVAGVMASPDFRQDNEILDSPEGFSPDYVILMNNKIAFVNEAVDLNPFRASHFFWVDAGYFQKAEDIPSDRQWVPRPLLQIRDKVTVVQMHDPELVREHTAYLHKVSIDPILIGGFYGGHGRVLQALYHLYLRTFLHNLHQNVVDDDQNVMLLCYFLEPSLFNLVPGSWYDAYKLFH